MFGTVFANLPKSAHNGERDIGCARLLTLTVELSDDTQNDLFLLFLVSEIEDCRGYIGTFRSIHPSSAPSNVFDAFELVDQILMEDSDIEPDKV